MDDTLNFAIYFFGSGLAFFVGTAMILLGIAVSPFANARLLKLARNLAVLVGGVFIAISATPLAWWLYGLLAVVTCIWLPLEWFNTSIPRKTIQVGRFSVLAIWLLTLVLELPYHFTPTLPAMGQPKLFLIGDSVSAGMIEADQGTWPKLLAREYGIDVRDFSKMGATVGSARKQAANLGDETGLVLLEIGGNDLLGATSAEQFEEWLELLLSDVCRKDRCVVMLELPLAPFANRYGQSQRRLAEQYGVVLIPKRIFIGVLTTSGATVDGVHLSRPGHVRMSAIVRPAFQGVE